MIVLSLLQLHQASHSILHNNLSLPAANLIVIRFTDFDKYILRRQTLLIGNIIIKKAFAYHVLITQKVFIDISFF